MFKKFLKIALLFTIIVVTSTWLVYLTEKQNTTMIRQLSNLDGDYRSLDLPIQPTNDEDYRQVIQAISETGAELKLPFLKQTWYQGHGNGKQPVNYQDGVNALVFESSHLATSPLAQRFNMRFRTGKIYTTKTNSHAEHLKKYGNLDITIKDLVLDKPPTTSEGDFFIETRNSKELTKFQQRLCEKLNERLHTNFSHTDFKESHAPLIIDSQLLDIQQIALSLSIFLLILIIVGVLSLSYEIGVLRYLGYDACSTTIHLIGPQIFWGNLAALTLGLFLLRMNYPQLIWPAFIAVIIIFLLEALFAYIVIYITYQLPVSRILVKRTFSKRTFLCLYVFKGILLSLILVTMLPLGDVAYQSFKLSATRERSALKDYAVFFPTSIGYNQRTLVDPQQTSEIDQKMIYPKIDQNGGLFIDTGAVGQPIAMQYQQVSVNENYLKFNPIYTVKGERFKSPQDWSGPVVLLPQQNSKLKRAIDTYYTKDLRSKKPLTVLIKNNQQLIDESGQKLKTFAYIHVCTKEAAQEPRNIFTGDAKDPLKVALHGATVSQVYKQYLPLLTKYNLTDNYPQLVRASDIDYHVLQQTLGNITAGIVTIITGSIAFLLLTISTAYLYFSIFGRTFAIKQTLGMSMLKSSHTFWLLWLTIAGLSAIALLGLGNGFNPPAFALFIIAIIADFLISFASVTVFSKRAIKGHLYD